MPFSQAPAGARRILGEYSADGGEYSADGGDQACFGVVGSHVGDVLDV